MKLQSIVMKHAQQVRKEWGVSLSVALKFAWHYQKTIFAENWSEDCVLIEAYKKDGQRTFRKAPKKSLSNRNGCVTFFSPYDLGTRSFLAENIISITSVKDAVVERIVREKAGIENMGQLISWNQVIEKIWTVSV